MQIIRGTWNRPAAPLLFFTLAAIALLACSCIDNSQEAKGELHTARQSIEVKYEEPSPNFEDPPLDFEEPPLVFYSSRAYALKPCASSEVGATERGTDPSQKYGSEFYEAPYGLTDEPVEVLTRYFDALPPLLYDRIWSFVTGGDTALEQHRQEIYVNAEPLMEYASRTFWDPYESSKASWLWTRGLTSATCIKPVEDVTECS